MNKTYLSQIRETIDSIDAALARMLGLRMQASKLIGALKQEEGITILDGKREADVQKKWRAYAKREKLDAAFADKILKLIFEESKRQQKY